MSRTRKNDPRGGLGTRRFYVIPGRQSESTDTRGGKLTLEAAIPAALQPKQMPAGYNVAEFSKDLHFILLHLIIIGDLAAPK